MKKSLIIITIAICMMVFTSCSSVDISSDFDPSIDFGSYKTYSFHKIEENKNDALAENPLVKKRVEAGVVKSLEAKGFVKTDETPDFVVILHAGDKEKTQITSYGYGGYGYGRYGYGGWGGYGMGGTQTDVYQYTETTLFIDIADVAKKELAWRGTATGVVRKYDNEQDRQDAIDHVVDRILESFPPQAK